MGNHVFGHSIGKEFVLRIGAQIDERQHSNSSHFADVTNAICAMLRCADTPLEDTLDCWDKAVTAAGQSFNVARRVCRISEDFAQAGDRVMQAVIEVDKRIPVPDLRAQFFAGDEVACAAHEGLQHKQRLTLQPQPNSLLPQLESMRVELEIVEAQNASGLGVLNHGSW